MLASSILFNVVQQDRHRHIPPWARTKTPHQTDKTGIESPVFREAVREMCIHYAGATFDFQAVLVGLANRLIKRFHRRTLR